MFNQYTKNIKQLFSFVDFLVITDINGYVTSYDVFNSLGDRIIKDPLGLHILELHQNLNEETSTVIRVLKNSNPIINEKQSLNIFKGITVDVLTTTFPLKEGNKIIGAVDINRYLDISLRRKTPNTNKNFNFNSLFFSIDDILTNNIKMNEIKKMTLKCANTNSPIMIYGETGTGKELIAQAIHNHSVRKNNPFIVENCSAIPLNLSESIFFGTTKGSFTDSKDKKGLFEMAHGGTLVLDELNSMDMALQSKLLRAIESNHIRRVGGSNIINTDVRIISILNEDPNILIKQNKLRRDFFYRLGVVLIRIPPLRERKDDIPILIDSFINKYNYKMNKNITNIDKSTKELLINYNWPGNVRELKHVIESIYNFIEGDIITEKCLPNNFKNSGKKEIENINLNDKFSLTNTMHNHEKYYIQLALESSDTLSKAASLLKISRQTLKYKMDTYGIKIKSI